MQTTLVTVLVSLLAVLVVAHLVRDWLAARRTREILESRDPLTEADFAQGAYPDSARKAEAARRLRSLLEKHKKLSMSGLRVTDRLAGDLNLDLMAEPDLFFTLEEEFGFETHVQDLERFSALVERLQTFADLVDYVDGEHWSL